MDCGDGVTHVTPIVDGYSVKGSINRMDLGGRDITNYLARLLRKSGTILHTSAEMEIVRNIKETKCCMW